MSRNTYPIETIKKYCSKYRTGEPVNKIVKECGVLRSKVYIGSIIIVISTMSTI